MLCTSPLLLLLPECSRDEELTERAVAGAADTCDAAPVDVPEQAAAALVSQSMYQDVRDGYAVYVFKKVSEEPVLVLCERKGKQI